MSEHADYYVEKVHYNKSHNRVMWATIHEDDGKRLGGAYNMLRKQMVRLLKQGKVFMTIYRNPEGKFRRGQRLAMVNVKGENFLRLDTDAADLAEEDRLSDVPEG